MLKCSARVLLVLVLLYSIVAAFLHMRVLLLSQSFLCVYCKVFGTSFDRQVVLFAADPFLNCLACKNAYLQPTCVCIFE